MTDDELQRLMEHPCTNYGPGERRIDCTTEHGNHILMWCRACLLAAHDKRNTAEQRAAEAVGLLAEAKERGIKSPQGSYNIDPGDFEVFPTKEAWDEAWRDYHEFMDRLLAFLSKQPALGGGE